MSSSRVSVYRQYTRSSSTSSCTSENLPPRTLARLAREVRNLQKTPPEGVRLVVDEESGLPSNLSELMVCRKMVSLCAESVGSSSAASLPSTATRNNNLNPGAFRFNGFVHTKSQNRKGYNRRPYPTFLLRRCSCSFSLHDQVELQGPQGTPYEGKYFLLKLVFSQEFPSAPPRGFFLTKLYHPNVDLSTGAICVNTLKKDWTSETTLSHVLAVIRCLLIVPFPESSLNDEAGKLFMESYDEYAKRARLMADVHGRSMSVAKTTPQEQKEPVLAPSKLAPSSSVGSSKSTEERGVLQSASGNSSQQRVVPPAKAAGSGPVGKKMTRKKSLKRL